MRKRPSVRVGRDVCEAGARAVRGLWVMVFGVGETKIGWAFGHRRPIHLYIAYEMRKKI
jgi:hypothetical protein